MSAGAAGPAHPSDGIALDERFMRVALALGARHVGLTWPNPSVGAVVVAGQPDSPRIVARGITQPGGRPHAERVALDLAGEAARGATLYVTLEPCSHHGRTPPCAEAVLRAGVARVVTAMPDPDPRVSGRGHALLRAAGIEVVTGVLEEQAARVHRGHVTRVTQGRPSVTVKLARTTDGFAARLDAPRLMITGPLANARTHLLRAHADAILIGAGTALADDPLLDVRLPGLEARSPIRVVFDSHLALPATARIVADAGRVPTWVVTTVDAPIAAEMALVARGVEVMRVGADAADRVDVGEALRLLAQRGITRVLCEGGPTLADALAAAGSVDEAVLITGSQRIGHGVPALGPHLRDALEGSLRHRESALAGADQIDVYERSA